MEEETIELIKDFAPTIVSIIALICGSISTWIALKRTSKNTKSQMYLAKEIEGLGEISVDLCKKIGFISHIESAIVYDKLNLIYELFRDEGQRLTNSVDVVAKYDFFVGHSLSAKINDFNKSYGDFLDNFEKIVSKNLGGINSVENTESVKAKKNLEGYVTNKSTELMEKYKDCIDYVKKEREKLN